MIAFGLSGALLAGCALETPAVSDGRPSPADVVSHSGEPAPDTEVAGLARPVMRPEFSQIENGAAAYTYVCMACHGDEGQGLTDAWRQAFGIEDSNCWQSKCHAANHPDTGFRLPRKIPAILGLGTLTRIANGLELHNLIADTMPWWNPGSLSAEESWAVTAYLLRERSALPERVTLDAGNAPIFRLHAPVVPGGDDRPGIVLLIGLLAISAAAFAAQNARRR